MPESSALTPNRALAPHVIVIGAGAAGLFAALHLKQLAPHCNVTVLEAGKAPLAKVKISGGGRCNVTHHCFELPRLIQFYPRGGPLLKKLFHRFGPQDTVKWYESRGVKLKTEPDGRMFPTTDSSQTIIDCLLKEAHKLGVEIRCQSPVVRVAKVETTSLWEVHTAQHTWQAQAVLFASGSAPAPLKWLNALGQNLIPQVPSLFTFEIKHPLLKDLPGVSFPRVKASLEKDKSLIHEGPMLITHWGLSGPAIIGLSAKGARILHEKQYQAECRIQFCPEYTANELMALADAFKGEHPKKTLLNGCPWPLPKRFWEKLLEVHHLPSDKIWAECPRKTLAHLAEQLSQYPFQITGKGQFKEEFVTAGGVDLPGIQGDTMESKHLPGLFFAGEILNIDGLTGGFNFQNAWSTGWVAAEGMAKRL